MPLFLIEVCALQREWINNLICPFITANRSQRAALRPPLYPYNESKDNSKECTVLQHQYTGTPLPSMWNIYPWKSSSPPLFFFLLNYTVSYAFCLAFLLGLYIQAFFSFELLLKYFTSVLLISKSTAHTSTTFACSILVEVVKLKKKTNQHS